MTEDQKKSRLRILIGEDPGDRSTEKDETLTVYLEMAADKILGRMYPYHDWAGAGYTVPAKYEMLQLKIAVYLLNKRGAQGETKHIEVGTERDYASGDIPEDMLKDVVPMCGIPG